MSWEVEVRRNGEVVVTIGDRMLAGRDLSESDQDLIRDCAEQLKAFAGPKKTPVCQCDGPWCKGPYPSGYCRECGLWYPGKPAEPATLPDPPGAPSTETTEADEPYEHCENCNKPLADVTDCYRTSDDVPLCKECFDELAKERG